MCRPRLTVADGGIELDAAGALTRWVCTCCNVQYSLKKSTSVFNSRSPYLSINFIPSTVIGSQILRTASFASAVAGLMGAASHLARPRGPLSLDGHLPSEVRPADLRHGQDLPSSKPIPIGRDRRFSGISRRVRP